jgi:hypothetical protein
MQTVIETANYLTSAKSAGMTAEERQTVVDTIAANPQDGDVMQGTGGCRKIRIAGKGKGKSGGYRVIFAFGGSDIPVFRWMCSVRMKRTISAGQNATNWLSCRTRYSNITGCEVDDEQDGF